MADDRALIIPEEVLILAVNPAVGEIPQIEAITPIFAASILFELACLGRIVSEGRAGFLLRDSSPTQNEFLDQCLAQLKAQASNHYLKYWIGRENPGFTEMAENFPTYGVKKGLLKRVQKRVAFIFVREDLEVTDPNLKNQLRLKVTSGGAQPKLSLDPRTYCLFKAIQAGARAFHHVIPLDEWNKLSEPVMDDAENVDADLIQRIYGTVSHCCS